MGLGRVKEFGCTSSSLLEATAVQTHSSKTLQSHTCVNQQHRKSGRRVALVVRESSNGIGNGFTMSAGLCPLGWYACTVPINSKKKRVMLCNLFVANSIPENKKTPPVLARVAIREWQIR